MRHKFSFSVFAAILFLLLTGAVALAQYTLPEDQPQPAESTLVKTDSVALDSAKTETLPKRSAAADSVKPEKSLYDVKSDEDTLTVKVPPQVVVEQAQQWVRRIFVRGTLDASQIGVWVRYQVTEWNERVGSMGPVLGRLTISYLGTSQWMAKDAEWFQAVYQSMDGDPTVVDFDILVPTAPKIKDFYRVIFRVNGEDMKPVEFNSPPEQPDFEIQDQPVSQGPEPLRLYSGNYTVEKYRGTGPDGTPVSIYRLPTLSPLGIIRLGYAGYAITYVSDGGDAVERFQAPPPLLRAPDPKKP